MSAQIDVVATTIGVSSSAASADERARGDDGEGSCRQARK